MLNGCVHCRVHHEPGPILGSWVSRTDGIETDWERPSAYGAVWESSQATQPHLEDGSVYRTRWWASGDSNQHLQPTSFVSASERRTKGAPSLSKSPWSGSCATRPTPISRRRWSANSPWHHPPRRCELLLPRRLRHCRSSLPYARIPTLLAPCDNARSANRPRRASRLLKIRSALTSGRKTIINVVMVVFLELSRKWES